MVKRASFAKTLLISSLFILGLPSVTKAQTLEQFAETRAFNITRPNEEKRLFFPLTYTESSNHPAINAYPDSSEKEKLLSPENLILTGITSASATFDINSTRKLRNCYTNKHCVEHGIDILYRPFRNSGAVPAYAEGFLEAIAVNYISFQLRKSKSPVLKAIGWLFPLGMTTAATYSGYHDLNTLKKCRETYPDC